MTFGLSATGFTPKTLDDVLSSLRTRQLATFGASFAVQLDTSVVGQLNGVMANEFADLWDMGLSVWRSRYPSTSEGVSLDLASEDTGATRLAAEKGTGAVTFSGTNGTFVDAGVVIQVPTTGARFVTTASGTVSGGTVTLTVEAQDYGPVIAAASDLNDLVTPIAGITSVTNALDITPGRFVETDQDFRIRRSNLLQVEGAATAEAIKARVLKLKPSGVTEVRVFNNPTNATDANGVPAKSFEVLVRGGAGADIAAAIYSVTSAGISSYGSSSSSITDSNGDPQLVYFSRPSEVLMYGAVTVTTDPLKFPADGDAQIKQAIVDFWNAFDDRIGKDVVLNAFYGVIYAIPGVTQVTVLDIDDVVSPSNPPVTTIGIRQIAVFDTSRITVTP